MGNCDGGSWSLRERGKFGNGRYRGGYDHRCHRRCARYVGRVTHALVLTGIFYSRAVLWYVASLLSHRRTVWVAPPPHEWRSGRPWLLVNGSDPNCPCLQMYATCSAIAPSHSPHNYVVGLYPNRMFINRGNHETKDMNRTYGFEGEAKHKYGEQTYKVHHLPSNWDHLFWSLSFSSSHISSRQVSAQVPALMFSYPYVEISAASNVDYRHATSI